MSKMKCMSKQQRSDQESVSSASTEFRRMNSSELCERSLTDSKAGAEEYIEIQILAADPPRCDSDCDSDLDDVLKEHQDFVKQMKAAMRSSGRHGGILPTISEESEALAEDFKPLEIERKIDYKDVMDQVQKFYRCYTEKMRKLDVLSYQTLQAISFLQLKDSEIPSTTKTNGKSESVSSSLKFPSNWMCYSSKVHDDPLQKSMDQMNCDLELVYVGQLCLSWEILTWFSAKTRQLICYDSQAKRSFGHAAERFQQFQVVLQRFVEEERFARERIPNYIQWRRVASNLLHVPNIKDDDSKVSKQEETDGNNAITIRDLVEVLDESQSIFRDFLFADIKSKNVVAGSSSSSSDLLSSIVTTLRRKEREWKKRKGRKQQERCRFEEVQVRVVSRVMNMSRVSVDQLLWCKTKLDAMGGGTTGEVGGFHSEPSFLIFPC